MQKEIWRGEFVMPWDWWRLRYRRNGWIGRLGLELLVAYESRTHYRPRFDFYGIARRSMPKIVSAEMNKAIARALQTRN